MSIRSYKDIYARFSELFPELVKKVQGWKGVRFAHRHICIMMQDGGSIHFLYRSSVDWELFRCPGSERMMAKC